MKMKIFGSLLTLSATLGMASAAWGHAVQTDYFVDLFSAQLEFTATYSTGEPMTEATVTIYAPGNDDSPWQEATTDTEGNFAFVPDESLTGDWRIEFEKEGHQDILIVPVNEDGIDYQNISQGPKTDFHYAAFAPELMGVGAAVGLGLMVVATRRRLATR
ncbi:MAG: carboxypeptidase-like regulatory domain-containing protein [Cyanobacteria bacterium]|nr:carboxypeptidase-like regulatory domain-containing protein [Cyanobacteriota bacterium]MEB3269390.1 carboxypeptidase-like regulatory domain-containing protein [Leptolyngbya sp.]